MLYRILSITEILYCFKYYFNLKNFIDEIKNYYDVVKQLLILLQSIKFFCKNNLNQDNINFLI